MPKRPKLIFLAVISDHLPSNIYSSPLNLSITTPGSSGFNIFNFFLFKPGEFYSPESEIYIFSFLLLVIPPNPYWSADTELKVLLFF